MPYGATPSPWRGRWLEGVDHFGVVAGVLDSVPCDGRVLFDVFNADGAAAGEDGGY